MNYTPENAASWRNYSLQVAKLLQKDATTLYDSWETSFQGGDAFKKTFTEHNGGDYTSALSCIEQIIDKCVEITDEVGNSKIGDPYNKWTAGQHTEALYAVESWYSFHSRDDYSNNIRSIRNSYFNSMDSTISHYSLYNLVQKIDPALNTKVATEIETASTTARYTFDLTDEFFYDEDHEAFEAEGNGTQFHDGTHGWVLKPTGKIKLLVGGHAYISLRMCNQGSNRTFTMTDENNNEIETFDGKASTDGEPYTVEYNGEAGWLTLTTTNADAYIHKIIIANVEDGEPVATNEEGYYVVKAGDGTHLMNTLDVVNSLPADQGRAYIFLPDGTYDLGNEVLTPISRDNVSIIGQSMDKTIIVNEAPVEGIGVSATFLITSTGTYMQDLTLKNAYDYYNKSTSDGRAVVIQDKGNHTICKNVRLLSYQDTYYSNANGDYYFENSDIHGTVDFICGSGDVFFNECTLTVEERNADGSGECTLTAPSTDTSKGDSYGYVFNNCTINSLAEKFNFGRAWNNDPRCAYLNTTLLQPEKLNSNHWTLGGMNVVADKFVEYNSMDANGKVISPESLVLKFTKDSNSNEYETILTAEQAEGYTLDKVFTDWTPGESAKQKELGLLKADGTSLTWDAVDGATAYAVFHNGEFVSMTATPSYTINEGSADEYTVRAANECGGFGKAASTTYTSGIDNVGAESGNVVSTAYYSVQGSRVSESYTGIVIKVETFDNGKTKTTKMVK